jgi:putative ABC transport system permease protein
VTVLAAIIFGLVPALQASRTNLHDSLKDRGTISVDRRRRRTRGFLVIAEVALSMVLLIGAGLMFRTLDALQATDLGLQADNAITFRVNVGFARTPEERAQFFAELEEHIGGLPDVTAVGATSVLPLSGRFWTSPYSTKDTEGDDWRVNEADYRFVTPGYFAAMGLELIDGRVLKRSDNLRALLHVVVDRRLAERAWPGQKPLGQHLKVEVFGQPEPEWVTVVGVVETVLSEGPDKETRETIYLPYLQQGAFPAMNVVVRAGKDPTWIVGGVRGIMAKMDPTVPVAGVRTMQSYVDDALAQTRFAAIMIALFALVALVMATVGISGVISSSVRQRRHEIGVHMAFGAPGSQILGLVLRRGLALTAAGVVLGIAVSLALTRVVGSLLTGVSATDPATFVSVAVLLTVVAAAASVVPAARALRVDPGKALRYE